MNHILQLLVAIVFFFILFKQYKKTHQSHLLVTLLALVLIGICRLVVPHLSNPAIRIGVVFIAVLSCALSYGLICRDEKKR